MSIFRILIFANTLPRPGLERSLSRGRPSSRPLGYELNVGIYNLDDMFQKEIYLVWDSILMLKEDAHINIVNCIYQR